VGQELQVLVEGQAEESEYLLKGRHRGQAPEIDGQVFLSLSEEMAETKLRPGDLVRARVTSFADYDLAAEVLAIEQAAPRVPQAIRLPMAS
jgi:ribosomal protein S12 methylthiotransferase